MPKSTGISGTAALCQSDGFSSAHLGNIVINWYGLRRSFLSPDMDWKLGTTLLAKSENPWGQKTLPVSPGVFYWMAITFWQLLSYFISEEEPRCSNRQWGNTGPISACVQIILMEYCCSEEFRKVLDADLLCLSFKACIQYRMENKSRRNVTMAEKQTVLILQRVLACIIYTTPIHLPLYINSHLSVCYSQWP